ASLKRAYASWSDRTCRTCPTSSRSGSNNTNKADNNTDNKDISNKSFSFSLPDSGGLITFYGIPAFLSEYINGRDVPRSGRRLCMRDMVVVALLFFLTSIDSILLIFSAVRMKRHPEPGKARL